MHLMSSFPQKEQKTSKVTIKNDIDGNNFLKKNSLNEYLA